MAKQFDSSQWKKINSALTEDPDFFGFPQRIYGSALIGSFNIRKLGKVENRSEDTWSFLARICSRYDLLAIQEVMDDLSGMDYLMSLLGPEFGMIVSDATGAFPGESGLCERLVFVFRWSVVRRAHVVSDLTFDRSVVLRTIMENMDDLIAAKAEYEEKMAAYESGTRKTRPALKMPCFLTFIRQPFVAAFKIVGHPGTEPYELMAVNAHLHFGDYVSDRRMEFEALMNWIRSRVMENDRVYYPNFLLLGDLNLDYNDPDSDRARMEGDLKCLDGAAGDKVNVNFPFLDVHPEQTEVFRTNARRTETFDQIGLFFRDQRWPTYDKNGEMGTDPNGPDYGVFDFVKLFSHALHGKSYSELSNAQQDDLTDHFSYSVSDHLPLWLRLPLP